MVITNPIVYGKFIKRINRFEAYVELNSGEKTLVHVPNTGRCKEIFVPGAEVILEVRDRQGRKTPYELAFAYKGKRLISIDSQVPNKVVLESIKMGLIDEFKGYDIVEKEKTFGNSKFDIKLTKGKEICYVEVKGVTLEVEGVAKFPDAPTERGRKHLKELIKVKKEGMRAAVIFLIQMDDIKYFTPNDEQDPEFGKFLREAVGKGVEAYAYTCDVGENYVFLKDRVEVVL